MACQHRKTKLSFEESEEGSLEHTVCMECGETLRSALVMTTPDGEVRRKPMQRNRMPSSSEVREMAESSREASPKEAKIPPSVELLALANKAREEKLAIVRKRLISEVSTVIQEAAVAGEHSCTYNLPYENYTSDQIKALANELKELGYQVKRDPKPAEKATCLTISWMKPRQKKETSPSKPSRPRGRPRKNRNPEEMNPPPSDSAQ